VIAIASGPTCENDSRHIYNENCFQIIEHFTVIYSISIKVPLTQAEAISHGSPTFTVSTPPTSHSCRDCPLPNIHGQARLMTLKHFKAILDALPVLQGTTRCAKDTLTSFRVDGTGINEDRDEFASGALKT